jgi:hypothetical protein
VRVEARQFGRRLRCSKCNGRFLVPAPIAVADAVLPPGPPPLLSPATAPKDSPRPSPVLAASLGCTVLFGIAAVVGVLIVYGLFNAFPERLEWFPAKPGEAHVRAGHRYELVGYFWGSDTDKSGRVVWCLKSRPPLVGAFGPAEDGYRVAVESAYVPQVRCAFDQPPAMLPLAGQRFRITGVAADTGFKPDDWFYPWATKLEHCTYEPRRDAVD